MKQAAPLSKAQKLENTWRGHIALYKRFEHDIVVGSATPEVRSIVVQGLWYGFQDADLLAHMSDTDQTNYWDLLGHHLLYRLIRVKHLRWGDSARMDKEEDQWRLTGARDLLDLAYPVHFPPQMYELNIPTKMNQRRHQVRDLAAEQGVWLPVAEWYWYVVRNFLAKNGEPVSQQAIQAAVDELLTKQAIERRGYKLTLRQITTTIDYYGLGTRERREDIRGFRLVPYRIETVNARWQRPEPFSTMGLHWVAKRHHRGPSLVAYRKQEEVDAKPAVMEPPRLKRRTKETATQRERFRRKAQAARQSKGAQEIRELWKVRVDEAAAAQPPGRRETDEEPADS